MTDKMQTRFKVIDNSGAKEVGLISVKNNKRACIGNFVTVSVKKIYSYSKVKRGEIYKAIVVRTKIPLTRKDGSTISFNENSVILLNRETLKPLATRLFGPVPKEVKTILNTSIIKILV